tara:strand:- start:435 stop:800 length:366 start_codon:yes stop_codon:yes gene_type:complete
MVNNYKKLAYPMTILTGFAISGCVGNDNQLTPSEVLPDQFKLDGSESYLIPFTTPTDLTFRVLDSSSGIELLFVDSGYDGELDSLILQNSKGREVIGTDHPYFLEWNEKFVDMRKLKFGAD